MNGIYNHTENIIGDWFRKGKNEKDTFNKFIYFWISFNAFYTANTRNKDGLTDDYKDFIGTKRDGDKIRIEYHSQVIEFKNIFSELISDSKMIDFHRYISEREHPEFSEITNGGIIKLDNQSQKSEYTNIKSLQEFLLLVYQVRNNMFHGGKNTSTESNKELVRKTNEVFQLYLIKIYNY